MTCYPGHLAIVAMAPLSSAIALSYLVPLKSILEDLSHTSVRCLQDVPPRHRRTRLRTGSKIFDAARSADCEAVPSASQTFVLAVAHSEHRFVGSLATLSLGDFVTNRTIYI